MNFRSKIGTNKGQAGSRIWIEGKRLIAAGFTRGTLYRRICAKGSICLVVENVNSPEWLAMPVEHRADFYKVAGKGEHPIIDITGADVLRNFKSSHVEVSYDVGCITIKEAK
jgi:hypothetical protein